jgi:hypothetical protein
METLGGGQRGTSSLSWWLVDAWTKPHGSAERLGFGLPKQSSDCRLTVLLDAAGRTS